MTRELKTTRHISPLITDFTGSDAQLLSGVSLDFEFTLHSPDSAVLRRHG